MKKNRSQWIIASALLLLGSGLRNASSEPAEQNKKGIAPLGKPGTCLTYVHPKKVLPSSVVRQCMLTLGPVEERADKTVQWMQVEAIKESRETFRVWMLCSAYPSRDRRSAKRQILRYLFQPADTPIIEYRHQRSGSAILPTTGAWSFLLPWTEKGEDPFSTPAKKIFYLGHAYQLTSRKQGKELSGPPASQIVQLNPELLIGVPHNTRQKDATRRYDESDYEYAPLTQADYQEMIDAGLNCLNVDAEQAKWVQLEDVYYWGLTGRELAYPEDLYRSNYIGPAIFFDEPMVGTRDRVVRPKLQTDPELRKQYTPATFFEDFKKLYHHTKYEEAATLLLKGLADRQDVDLGEMQFLQQNIYSWETMVSSAAYQLGEGHASPPYAMVFEPPGRFGSRRILPEWNMCFDCQFPVNSPKNLIDVIYGFLRGAARLEDKEWGVSIYGGVDRADSFWFLTHAYDLGATLFFYWDTYQLACVPYPEVLAMTRHLQAHAKNFPERDLAKLKKAGEVAILLPPGYNLGHVQMGRGNLSGLAELNMERTNRHGIKYRQIMSNFLLEAERCLRLGVEADYFWQLEDLDLSDYREVVTVLETGQVRVVANGQVQILNSGRTPERPAGTAPQLSIAVNIDSTLRPAVVTARAQVIPGSAPIFYTPGADKKGIYHNHYVLWELYGPEPEDYSNLWQETWKVAVSEKADHTEVEIKFNLERRGRYRLRAATADWAGRSAVVWQEMQL